jgi:Flp pilus assembly protein TadD
LDPTSPVIAAALGEAYYQSRRYDLSIEQNQKSLELDPTFAVGLVNQGRALTQQGKHEQAQRDFQLALAASPNDAALLACLGYEYAVSDNNAGAREIIGRLQKLQAQGYVPAVYFAAIYTGLGDKDEAFRWLNRALNERCEYLVYIQNDPMSEPLLKDPRFTELLRKIGIVKTVAFSIPTQWFRAA